MVDHATITHRKPSHTVTIMRILENGSSMPMKLREKNLSVGARRQTEIYDAKLAIYKYKTGDEIWSEKTSVRPGLSPKLQPLYQGPC